MDLLNRLDAPLAGVVLVAVADGANDYYYYYQRGRSARAHRSRAQGATGARERPRHRGARRRRRPVRRADPRPPTSRRRVEPAVDARDDGPSRVRTGPHLHGARSRPIARRDGARSPPSCSIFDLGLATWLWVTDPREVAGRGGARGDPAAARCHRAPLHAGRRAAETRFDLAGLLATGLLLRFAGSFFRFQQRGGRDRVPQRRIEPRGKLPQLQLRRRREGQGAGYGRDELDLGCRRGRHQREQVRDVPALLVARASSVASCCTARS